MCTNTRRPPLDLTDCFLDLLPSLSLPLSLFLLSLSSRLSLEPCVLVNLPNEQSLRSYFFSIYLDGGTLIFRVVCSDVIGNDGAERKYESHENPDSVFTFVLEIS